MNQYSIYVNGIKLLFTIDANKRSAMAHIKRYLKDTHMGQWRKIPGGWAYDTTIGKYYEFVKGKA